MRIRATALGVLTICLLGSMGRGAGSGPRQEPPDRPTEEAALGKYVLIGWNDLGMHCISPRFAEMAILPPYNTVWAIVIQRGKEPKLVTSGATVTYALNNNTTVKGKTDFWTYAPKLFGTSLKPGMGLAGFGLSGTMKRVGDHFEAVGIPALPFNDQMKWDSYQDATLKLSGIGTAKASVVVPVSDEMNCQKCHAAGKAAGKSIVGAKTLEQYILMLHDKREGTKLMSQRPVLCASCHADPALGTAGKKGVSNMSLAMHGKHARVSPQPTCFDCHPGAVTKCNRSAIEGMGPVGTDPKCSSCHGTLTQMASKLKAGRKPWQQEPTCAQCHGAEYSTGTTLYRNAKGHGGIYCAACHNSPHAWWPSKRADDNAQAIALQGRAAPLGHKACYICHTDGRTGDEPPHGRD